MNISKTGLLPFKGDFSFEKSQKSQGAKSGLTELGDVMLSQKRLHKSCRMGKRIAVMKLICSLGRYECDGHAAHKLSQFPLTAD